MCVFRGLPNKSSFGQTRHWRRNATGDNSSDEVLKCPIPRSNNGPILRFRACARKFDDVALATSQALTARVNMGWVHRWEFDVSLKSRFPFNKNRLLLLFFFYISDAHNPPEISRRIRAIV